MLVKACVHVCIVLYSCMYNSLLMKTDLLFCVVVIKECEVDFTFRSLPLQSILKDAK